MIEPTNGRVVLYHPNKYDGIVQHDKAKPLAAVVVHVWGPQMVNLVVFSSDGTPQGRSSVVLLQDDDTAPADNSFCEWMPYQKGQAAKTEKLEAALQVAATVKD